MSIEQILLSAESHGKRTAVIDVVTKLKEKSPTTNLAELYEEAYQKVMMI